MINFCNEITRIGYTLAGRKNKQGLAMAHLAVLWNGSDSDFEETVHVLNGIWFFLFHCVSGKQIYP